MAQLVGGGIIELDAEDRRALAHEAVGMTFAARMKHRSAGDALAGRRAVTLLVSAGERERKVGALVLVPRQLDAGRVFVVRQRQTAARAQMKQPAEEPSAFEAHRRTIRLRTPPVSRKVRDA